MIGSFQRFCTEAGEGVSMEWNNYYFIKEMADTSDSSPWWRAFSSTLNQLLVTPQLPTFMSIFSDCFILEIKNRVGSDSKDVCGSKLVTNPFPGT